MITERIKLARQKARVEKDSKKAAILGVLLGDIQTRQLREGVVLDNAQVTKMMKKFAENCESTNDEYGAELARSFLPKQMTDSELETVIHGIIAQQDNPNIGTIMPKLVENYAGLYDGKTANAIIRKTLGM